MKYYLIKLKSLPVIRFAHTFYTKNYDFSFNTEKDFMEISYILEGDVTIESKNYTEKVPENSIMISTRTEPTHVYADTAHCHVTFGFNADFSCFEYDYHELKQLFDTQNKEKYHFDNNDVFDDIILPQHALFENGEEYKKKLFKILEEYALQRKTNVKLENIIFSLLADLDADARKLLFKNREGNGEIRYAERAKRYVIKHLCEKIYVQNIAKELGLSVGYLSKLFRRVTDMTLIEYVNRTKLARVEELIKTRGLSLKDASFVTGFEDEHYVSRIYKKYFGTNLKRPSK